MDGGDPFIFSRGLKISIFRHRGLKNTYKGLKQLLNKLRCRHPNRFEEYL